MGFKGFESFKSNAVAQTGDMPMPAEGKASGGGHAVFIAGYKTDLGTPGGGCLIVNYEQGSSFIRLNRANRRKDGLNFSSRFIRGNSS